MGGFEYELGLPVAAWLERAAPTGFDLGAALRNPLVRALRYVARRRSKRTGRSAANAKLYHPLLRTLLPQALLGFDCDRGALEVALSLDCSRVTHLFAVDFIGCGSMLAPGHLPGVTRGEVLVSPGTAGAVFGALAFDRFGFLKTNCPHLELTFVGQPTEAELAELEARQSEWKARAVTWGSGRSLSPGRLNG